tara:strand:- start:884 stop:2002 length:1119 start_codon:yes stop_codon:yes gene_type:complete
VHLVLFFTKNVSLTIWDSIGILAREITIYKEMVNKGNTVSFITYGDKTDLKYASKLGGINIYCNHIGLKSFIYEKSINFIHRKVISSADIIKTNQMFGADVAVRSSKKFKKPLINRMGYIYSEFKANETSNNSEAYFESRRYEKEIINFADHVVVTTSLMSDKICEQYTDAVDKISIIPNFVDTDIFKPKLSVDKDYDVIFIGRLEPQKNLKNLLDALSILKLSVLIIGSGSQGKELKSKYNSLISSIDWKDNLPNHSLPNYLNRAKIFVLPSFYEGHPKVLIEAMAVGTPIVAANSPGIREIITHCQNGYLCATDKNGIQKAINDVLNNIQLQKKMSKNAVEYVRDNFSIEKILRLELDLIKKLNPTAIRF